MMTQSAKLQIPPDESGSTATARQTDSVQLEDAFALFNRLSAKLADSYNELERQVARLTAELEQARSERLQQLAEKERIANRLESLLDILPAGVIVVDENDRIRQANPVAHDMLGEDICGGEWTHLAGQRIASHGNELQLPDGRWISVSSRALQGEPGRLILLNDVTQTRDLQSRLGRQQRLSSLGEMVARLAHQLRTPLATALLYMSALDHPGSSSADRMRFGSKARERLLHLERMVNDMLIFARGDVIALENIHVPVLLQQLQDGLEQLLKTSGVNLQIENLVGDVVIRASQDTLLSIFQNLADNAIAACRQRYPEEEGSSAMLKIQVTRCSADEVCFAFLDNGCGIESRHMQRVLEPFYTTRSSGTGLGLAVVNSAVQGFHGSLQFFSREGEGSCFEVRLPMGTQNRLLDSDIAMYLDNQVSDGSKQTACKPTNNEVTI